VKAGDDNNRGEGFTIKTVHLQLGRGSEEIVHMYVCHDAFTPKFLTVNLVAVDRIDLGAERRRRYCSGEHHGGSALEIERERKVTNSLFLFLRDRLQRRGPSMAALPAPRPAPRRTHHGRQVGLLKQHQIGLIQTKQSA